MRRIDRAYGRRLIADLRELGLDDLDAEVEVHTVRGGSRLATWHQLSAQALRPHVLATGADASELDLMLAALDDPAFLEVGFAWVAAWGSRSTSGWTGAA